MNPTSWKFWLCRYRWLIAPISAWAAVILTATLFLHLASEVREGETRSFDAYCLHLAQIARATHPWLEGVMRDLSGLGSAVALVLFTIMVSGYLALARSRQTALILICSIGTGIVAVELFKAIYGRVRPDVELAAFPESGLSFPSGHSSMAAMVFLTLGTLWASTHSQRWQRVYILGVSAMLTILVGVSRAALGVHWATDVLGGWAFGTAWAAAWLSVAKLTSNSAHGQK